MDKATLTIESKTQGVQTSERALRKLTDTSKKAKRATDSFTQATTRASVALTNRFRTGLSRVATFMRGEGSSGASKLIGKFKNLSSVTGLVSTAMITMIGIKVVRWMNNLADAATSLTAGLANIATLLPGQQSKVLQYGTEIQKLSVELGKTQEDLSDATYQVVSAFGDQENTMATLRTTAKASTAGLASTTDALNLLSAVSKGYNNTTSETISKISDLAFTTVKLGQTTFPELAAAIGRAVPLAEALGVSMEELFAVEATLTGVTGSAAEVTTQLRSILTAMVKPTTDLRDLFADLGVKSGREFLEVSGGLAGALDAIKRDAHASGNEMASYLGRVEGLTGALALTGAQADVFKMKQAEMYDAIGATDEALEEQLNGINKYGTQITQFSRRWEVLKTNLGQVALVLKARLAEAFAPVIDRINNTFGSLEGWIVFAEIIVDSISLSFSKLNKIIQNTMDRFTAVGFVIEDIANGNWRQIGSDLEQAYNWIETRNADFERRQNQMIERSTQKWEDYMKALESGEVTNMSVALQQLMEDLESVNSTLSTGQKTWQDWLRTTLDLGESLKFDTGAEAVEFYAERQERLATATAKFAVAVGETQDTLSLYEQQLTDVRNVMIALYSLSEEEVDEAFKGSDLSIQALISRYQQLENKIRFLKATMTDNTATYLDIIAIFDEQRAEINRASEAYKNAGLEYDKAAKLSELYNSTLEILANNVNITAEDIEVFRKNLGALNLVLRDTDEDTKTLFDILSKADIERFLTYKLNIAKDKTEELADSLFSVGEALTQILGTQALEFWRTWGEETIKTGNALKGLSAAAASVGEAILNSLPQLMLEIGVALMRGGATWAGLSFVLGSGLVSLAGGVASGAIAKAQENAQGNVFSGGNVIPFARGGIVSQPTVFPMANGGIGLMGERAEEAIMPLARTPSGDLGVRSTGGGSVVNIRVENHSKENVDIQRDPSTREIVVMIGNVVDANIRSGRHDKALNTRYGSEMRGVS